MPKKTKTPANVFDALEEDDVEPEDEDDGLDAFDAMLYALDKTEASVPAPVLKINCAVDPGESKEPEPRQAGGTVQNTTSDMMQERLSRIPQEPYGTGKPAKNGPKPKIKLLSRKQKQRKEKEKDKAEAYSEKVGVEEKVARSNKKQNRKKRKSQPY